MKILFTLWALAYASLAEDLMEASKGASHLNHNMGHWAPQIDSMSVLRWQTDYLPFSTALFKVNKELHESSLVDLHKNHARVGAMCAQITDMLNHLTGFASKVHSLGLREFMAYDVRDIALKCESITKKLRERNPDGELSSTLDEMASAFTEVLARYRIKPVNFSEDLGQLSPQRLWMIDAN